MIIRRMEGRDFPRVMEIWNASVKSGEVVYYELTDRYFQTKFLDGPCSASEYRLAAEDGGYVVGFIMGAVKAAYLPGETCENTPGYITCIFVDKACRSKGVGTALLAELTSAFALAGKRRVCCSGGNPVNLDWIIPGTARHDHNNAPGMDMDCAGYSFLLRRGFSAQCLEDAMYLDLAAYREPPGIRELRAKLLSEGIVTGRYDFAPACDYDRMCTRVGSEYWRKVLYDETHAVFPRPILAATAGTYMVGFTGPVDRQPSGRGWFTGICTDPEYERRGIATVLFDLLMKEFIAAGAAFSTLFTGRENHARKIYLRAGFRVARSFAIMDKEIT